MKNILLSLRYFCLSIVGIIALWLLGFCLFAITLPNAPSDMTKVTDAIVVLTGGKGRVELGSSLLNAGLGNRLLISGVYPDVTVETLIRKQKIPEHLAQSLSKAELEYSAQDTAGNAKETAKWVKEHNIGTIRLVTGNYHIRRSMIEFKRLLPDLIIIPHPVPEQHSLSAKTFPLLWNEYVKLTLVWLGYRLMLQN
jgi:uncharacterized SAM-binding protein YcdF (DUF218 family)